MSNRELHSRHVKYILGLNDQALDGVDGGAALKLTPQQIPLSVGGLLPQDLLDIF